MLSMASEEDQSLLGHLLVVAGKVADQLGSLMRSAWSLITVQVVAKRYSTYTYIFSLVET